ncbi:uncharacterized protein LOC126736690 [Anthonomus grandis grandis]|uniref:uncharacterized protein LOC126736690 n=1 Tax=Anthonomus grandis grandis TaxID=2921223 RepID=UPI0021669F14|nr:uncharacterized protein LOC126736690 [Anthonomus grandis grandis]
MKSVVFLLMLTWLGWSVGSQLDCRCWPDWKPVLTEEGDWICKDANLDKTFHCNIDVPPKCVCKDKGVEVQLPLGEINCVGDIQKTYDNINCNSNPEWEAWFGKYPQYRLYH